MYSNLPVAQVSNKSIMGYTYIAIQDCVALCSIISFLSVELFGVTVIFLLFG